MNRAAFDETQRRLRKAGHKVVHARYDEAVFGSWGVEIKAMPFRRRLVWEAKDQWFVVQTRRLFRRWQDEWVGRDGSTLEAALDHLTRR